MAVERDGIRVRVGVVSWNTATLLDDCLAALPAAMAPFPYDAVVVDNASADASADVAASHPDVVVVRNGVNVGYARAINQALAGTDAEVLIALNPDTVAPPGSLATLVARLWDQPDVALVAPRLIHPDGVVQTSAYRFPAPVTAAVEGFLWGEPVGVRARRRWCRGRLEEECGRADIDWAIGAVHVLRRAALEGPAPYDERWFMYIEDLALCFDLARRGWRRRLEADVTVVHVGNASGEQQWAGQVSARCQSETYDWYQREHGRVAVRLWALLNAIGAVAWGVCIAAASVWGDTVPRRTRAVLLRQDLVRHLRVLVAGPAPPASPPPPKGS